RTPATSAWPRCPICWRSATGCPGARARTSCAENSRRSPMPETTAPADRAPEANGPAALEVASLRKEFGPLVAVDDVSFGIPEAGSLAIVGEWGSGKTTIARMIVGLERPTRGTIMACGHDRSRPTRSARNRRRRGREVQIVFQDPYTSLDPRQSAEATIDEVLRLHHGWRADRRQARTAELIDLVGLDTRQGRAPPRSPAGRPGQGGAHARRARGRAASGSGSRSPGRSRPSRPS